ncbi:MAG: hypothetical protein ABIH25_01290 [Candidatus Woesearchaeota archaeon]
MNKTYLFLGIVIVLIVLGGFGMVGVIGYLLGVFAVIYILYWIFLRPVVKHKGWECEFCSRKFSTEVGAEKHEKKCSKRKKK